MKAESAHLPPPHLVDDRAFVYRVLAAGAAFAFLALDLGGIL
jgi:hypothetical protein